MNVKRWVTVAMVFFVLGILAAIAAFIAGVFMAKDSPMDAMKYAMIGTGVCVVCLAIGIQIVKIARKRYKKALSEGKISPAEIEEK